MKIRTGFVSNSSSSSFIAIGVKVPKIVINDDRWEISYKSGYSIYDDDENGYSNDTHAVIGIEIAVESDGYMESIEYTQKNFNSTVEDIREQFGVDGEPIIIAGTRMS